MTTAVNVRDIQEFCMRMGNQFGARFTTKQNPRGLMVWGEFYTRRGQLVRLQFEANPTRIKSGVYNAQQRCIYSDTSKSLLNNQALFSCIQRIYQS